MTGNTMAGNPDTTVVITSCGRQDLLENTLETFLRWNTAPVDKIIVIEDGPGERNAAIAERFADARLLWLATERRAGQIHAVDEAYSQVETPYIFHCEDDWEFYASGFIELSRLVLESSPSWLQVYLRAINDIYTHPLFEGVRAAGEARYRVLQHDWDADYYGFWHGFAFNPGLRRRSDYRRIGTYGKWATFHADRAWEAERRISEVYKNLGYYATILVNNDGRGFVRHTGNERHVGPEISPKTTQSTVEGL